MKNIVISDTVQGLVSDLLCEIEYNSLINMTEYASICRLIQATINEENLLLEPLEVASIIEEAVMIYSSKNVKADSKRAHHFYNAEESVKVAFKKQLGIPQEELKLN